MIKYLLLYTYDFSVSFSTLQNITSIFFVIITVEILANFAVYKLILNHKTSFRKNEQQIFKVKKLYSWMLISGKTTLIHTIACLLFTLCSQMKWKGWSLKNKKTSKKLNGMNQLRNKNFNMVEFANVIIPWNARP